MKFVFIPDAAVHLDAGSLGKDALGARYRVRYPGRFVGELQERMCPFILLEVGEALVRPFEKRALSSFVHDWLATHDKLGDYRENRPGSVRCVHPLVTLVEKIDAIARRYPRGEDPAPFIRHYEDAARIIEAEEHLPTLSGTLGDLIESMIDEKRIRRLPGADDPSFTLEEPERRAELERAHRDIDPKFWGGRLTLEDAAGAIRRWLSHLARSGR